MSVTYEILPYSRDVIANHICLVTETPFHQLRQKKQILYLDTYIKNYTPKLNNPVVVIEYNYTERHYLEDYAKYFSRCLHEYPRKCSRIHIFDWKEDAGDLKTTFDHILSEYEKEAVGRLSGSYLGFIVIRPIPSTVFAKVCLKPYGSVERNIITRQYTPSLFGIPLSVETVAFQEQDRILSACATSALWSLYNAHNCMNLNAIPSPNRITADATNGEPVDGSGLSSAMICRGLQRNGLAPRHIVVDEDCPDFYNLREQIHAYCSSNIPLIMGVEVLDKNENILGSHAVTVLGFDFATEGIETLGDSQPLLRMNSHRINRIYVHDDRVGPFARLEFKLKSWKMSLGSSEEVYKPQNLIYGTYHKIRIPFIDIKKTCVSFVNRLEVSIKLLDGDESDDTLLRLPKDLVWDIVLKTNHKLKEEILISDNPMVDKVKLLTGCVPLYVWVATATFGDNKLFQLLFDPTDIPQGNVFIDVIYYHKAGRKLIEILRDDCKTNYFRLGNDELFERFPEDDHFGGIVNYFLKDVSYSEKLDNLFGESKLPKYFKTGEIQEDAIRDQHAELLYSAFDNPEFVLDKKRKYIWAVNKEGGLLLGFENNSDEENVFAGHITLTHGKPARIAGELNFKDGNWYINSKSGRYSVDYTPEEKSRYLENVANQRFRAIFPEDDFVVSEVGKNT